MLKRHALALAALAAFAAPALSSSRSPQQPPSPDTDRVPNRDPWQVYPRWTGIKVGFDDSNGPAQGEARELAVQEDGTAHVLALANDDFASPSRRKILYGHNRPEGRARNGFSSPVLLNETAFPNFVFVGDIAASRDGRLTALYLITKNSGLWTDIHARQFNPATGQWSGDSPLTTGSQTVNGTTTTTTTYGAPSVVYDETGTLHLIYMEKIRVDTTSPTTRQETRTIFYRANLGTPEILVRVVSSAVSITQVFPEDLPSDATANTGRSGIPALAAASDGTPHVAWCQDHPNQTVSIRHASRQGAAGWPSTILASGSPPGCDFDVAVDEARTAHVVYSRPGINQPAYRRKATTDSSFSTEEAIPGLGDSVKLSVDSRRQPVVVMSSSARTSFATKVNNPAVVNPAQWVVQAGLDSPGSGAGPSEIVDVFVTPGSEFVHFLAGNYVRSTELNTGNQDSFTLVPFGPNSAANVATGNLRFELPLFSARSGFGFSTNFSLIYNSLDGERGTISPGWSTSYDMYLADPGTDSPTSDIANFTLHLGEGRIIPFSRGFGTFGYRIAADEFGYFSRIDRGEVAPMSQGYILTTKFGIKYFFDGTGRLVRMEDTQSPPNRMEFTYTNGLLTAIQDSPLRPATILMYDASKRLERVQDPGGSTYTLSYQTLDPGPNPSPGKLEKVKFDAGPAGQTIEWRFEYYTANNYNPSATPPIEEHKGLLSKLHTPRGNQASPKYFHQFGYKLDGRVVSSTEPSEESATDDSAITPDLPTSPVQARRSIAYIDPVEPFSPPDVDEGPTGTRTSPAALFKDRRGFETRIEYQYARCLADRIHEPPPAVGGAAGRIRRFFDTQELQDSGGNIIGVVPRFRNLKRFVDKEGNETLYVYTHEEGTKEQPLHVRDNLRRIRQPLANSSDPAGAGGAPAAGTAGVDTAKYEYHDFFSRVHKVTDALSNVTEYSYNATTGNLTQIKYPPIQGVSATEGFMYEARGRVETHQAPRGGITTFKYDEPVSGLATEIKRPDHVKAETFRYDSLAGEGRMGLVKEHTLPEGGLTKFNYDDLHRTSRQEAPQGDAASNTDFTYDLDSNLETVDGPDGAFASHEYDKLGRLKKTTRKETASRNLETLFKYDKEGATRQVRDPRQKFSITRYDALGRVVEERRPGSPGPVVVSTFQYNLNGSVSQSATGASTTATTYTGRGLVAKTENTGFQAESDLTRYFEDGTVERSQHSVNQVIVTETINGYDARRRLTSTIQVAVFGTTPVLFTTQLILDAEGNRTMVIDPELRVTEFVFDLAGRQTDTVDGLGRIVSKNVYDDDDRLDRREVVHPNSTTGGTFVLAVDNGYNARGELKTQTDIAGQVTRMFYDGRGNQVRRESPAVAGQMAVALMEYDFAGRLRRETRAQGTSAQSVWEYDYDENGNRTLVRDPRLFEYRFFYDDANRLRELHYPMVAGSSFIESWTYDDRGNLQTHTDLEGKVATHTYDLQNRALTETHVKNAQTAAAIEKGYDHQGNLVFVWDQATAHLVAYTNQANLPAYDALNRLTEARWVKEATSVSLNPTTKVLTFNGSLIGRVAYGYDQTSRLTSAVVSVVAGGGFEDHAYAYTYDANGRLDEVRRGGPGQTPVLVADHVWTVAGAKKEVQFSNGHAQVSDYDVEGRVQHLRLRRPDQQTFSSHLEYEYDERDRRRAIVFHTLQRRVDYGYDDQDRLTGETWTSTAPGQTPPPCQNNIQDLAIGNVSVFAGPVCVTPTSGALLYQASWTYDGSGNRLTQTVNQGPVTSYAYDAQNRLTSAGPVGYTYTRNGNQETRTEGGVTESFTYDYMNRVKTYLKGSVSFMYVYMPTGERVTKLNVPAGTEETFFYDGQDVVADYTRSGGGPLTLARTYVNTPSSIDSKLARIEAGGALHFYVGDALGSVHEMMDTAGTTVRRELYTAWGEKLPGFAGIDFPDRYAFTHRERDDESALMHYRARSYDPRTGRFLQKDPRQGNRVAQHYTYAQNSPIANTDPLGEDTKKEWQDKALREAGISSDHWVPIKGFSHNKTVMANVYRWYQKTWQRKPDRLHWAGIAYLAGGSVYGGLQRLSSMKPYIHGLAAYSAWDLQGTGVKLVENLDRLEVAVIKINKDIFMDLAWQHVAFLERGILELRARSAANELDKATLDAWEDIESGVAARVWKGNYELLRREQKEIAQAGYEEVIKIGMIRELSLEAINPLPGEKSFSEAFPGGNLTLFSDRWTWISKNIWDPWRALEPRIRDRLLSTSFEDVVERRFPK